MGLLVMFANILPKNTYIVRPAICTPVQIVDNLPVKNDLP